ncbi:YceD family protein [Teredinibacter purpureus]|uniref:YceD family protein n=1 Tax=Teredinibacter purpureus TaxID=2731756 RepID=UPI0005F82B4D|nr:YceD family protein [Teredinibacter purpureus]
MSEGALIKQLPKLVDPRKLAHMNVKLVGIVPEESLPRLRDASFKLEATADGYGAMAAELEFFRDDQGRRLLSGQVSSRVRLECQRCLEALELNIEADVNLAVVFDEDQAQRLPSNLEPWIIVTDGRADLHAVLEDELLLALPASALHDFECIDASRFSVGDETEEAQASDSDEDNPFNVLASLKQDMKNTDNG